MTTNTSYGGVGHAPSPATLERLANSQAMEWPTNLFDTKPCIVCDEDGAGPLCAACQRKLVDGEAVAESATLVT